MALPTVGKQWMPITYRLVLHHQPAKTLLPLDNTKGQPHHLLSSAGHGEDLVSQRRRYTHSRTRTIALLCSSLAIGNL
ncbi:hypothetical protein AAFC00_005032 [Neodothiora populina]|uniref:Uncharacterized protein n=1 Tax=Neodothiora populina TaxID=2781224 RepID=A0ABR3P5E3_9PEZI